MRRRMNALVRPRREHHVRDVTGLSQPHDRLAYRGIASERRFHLPALEFGRAMAIGNECRELEAIRSFCDNATRAQDN